MSSETFKNIARAIASTGLVHDTYDLLTIADAVEKVLPVQPFNVNTHDGLVQFALNHAETLGHMRDGKKINAIKALRTATSVGLLEAKNACEDQRVYSATGYEPQSRW